MRYPYPYPGCVQGPIVINCFAQWGPGPPSYRSRVPIPRTPLGRELHDVQGQREVWFRECLQAIGRLRPIPSPIAFPKNIGCGLGGGHWPNYETMILQFAIAHPECEVMIVSQAQGSPGYVRARVAEIDESISSSTPTRQEEPEVSSSPRYRGEPWWRTTASSSSTDQAPPQDSDLG